MSINQYLYFWVALKVAQILVKLAKFLKITKSA
jgi:hypothetical protein